MDTIQKRIQLVRRQFCTTNKQFAEILGESPTTTSNWMSQDREIGMNVTQKILDAFPSVNPQWLRFGEGPMLKPEPNTINEDAPDYGESCTHNIPLLPISAQGGRLSDFMVSVKNSECEQIVSPIKGVDFAVTVFGDSMEPEFPNGCQVLIKKIDEKSFIEWGKVYVLDTINGVVIKVLTKSDDPGFINCSSLHQDQKRYAPFSIPVSDVFGVYRVLMCMCLK